MAKTIRICDASFPFSIYTQLTIERVLSCHYKALLQSGHWSFVRLAGSLSVRFGAGTLVLVGEDVDRKLIER